MKVVPSEQTSDAHPPTPPHPFYDTFVTGFI